MTTVGVYVVQDDGSDLARAIAALLAAPDAHTEHSAAMRLQAITAPARRREFVLGRRLAAHALREQMGIGGWSLRGAVGRRPIAHRPNGDTHRALSVSHSGGTVVCAVATDNELRVGCDLEVVRSRSASSWRRLGDLAHAHPVFSARERQWLTGNADEATAVATSAAASAARDERLCALWTIKEAIAKAMGTGIFRAQLHAVDVDVRALAQLLDQAGIARLNPDAASLPALLVRRTQAPEQSATVAATQRGSAKPVESQPIWCVQMRRLPRHWLAVATPWAQGQTQQLALHLQTLVCAALLD